MVWHSGAVDGSPKHRAEYDFGYRAMVCAIDALESRHSFNS